MDITFRYRWQAAGPYDPGEQANVQFLTVFAHDILCHSRCMALQLNL
jgi:hypothetical protein